MEKETTFCYRYSAKVNKEVQEIRRKYLPPCENKLEELKRLDRMVQTAGIVPSLCVGGGGVLVFGLGLCLVMRVIAGGAALMLCGVLLAVVGAVGMGMAYPVYRRVFGRTKERYAARILALVAELTGETAGS